MDIAALRIDLRRTQERLDLAREKGDQAAVMIGESRLRRVTAELTAALGLRLSTTSATGTSSSDTRPTPGR